ncbi:MAG: hypothetical protein AAFP17_13185 [Pseudomonadota bacterium]
MRSFVWAVAPAVAGALSAQAAQIDVVLFSENFEGVPLGQSPQEDTTQNGVWSETPPTGWTVDNSGVPGQGDPTEGIEDWEGWAFVDEDFWLSADDQQRSQFRDGFGEGTIAVADPDEWDDIGDPADTLGFFDAFLTTPEIDISAAPAGSLHLEFASSWRDEAFDDGDDFNANGNNQTATIRVSYDGGTTYEEVLRWESDPTSAFFKDDAPNEMVMVALDNPETSMLLIEFGLTEAGNDWWWALDNIQVGFAESAIPLPLTAPLLLGGLGGLVVLARRRKAA